MKTKRIAFLVVVLLAVTAALSFADIGENFAKGGVALSGSIEFYNNFYRIADSTDKSNYWSLDVSPSVDFYIMDRFSVGVSGWFNYNTYTNKSTDTTEKEMGFGFSLGGSYAFVMNPAAQKGLVVSLGGAIGLDFIPGVSDVYGGVETVDKSNYTNLTVRLTPRLYYFVNDRLAPFIGVTPQLVYILSYKNTTGTKVDLTSKESLYLRLTATIGIAWYIPSKKASLFGGS
jgi:hypothetical protein